MSDAGHIQEEREINQPSYRAVWHTRVLAAHVPTGPHAR
jgi:hypothetical protein